MGGNALKGFECIRLDRDAYFQLESEVIAKLRILWPHRQILTIPAYQSKPSFGDMDLLVEKQADDSALLYSQIIDCFQSRAFFKNSNIFSFEYQRFQIDLIFEEPKYLLLAQAYFSWNDRGNLIGKLYHRFSLNYGHHGLKFKRYHGKQMFQEIVVSEDLNRIWGFLGLSYERDLQGFKDLDEMFMFIHSSPYFDLRYFQYENLNTESRSRDSKRKTYQAFLDFCQSLAQSMPPPLDQRISPSLAPLPLLFEYFEGFQDRYDQVTDDIERFEHFRSKFNGALITQICQRTEQSLGKLIMSIKSSYPSERDFQDAIEQMGTQEIHQMILAHHHRLKAINQ